jgi:hypothetical protein
MKIRSFLGGPLVAVIFITSLQSDVIAQSQSTQFEGELFTARVMNVTVAKQNGNVFVTVLFRGKSFKDSFRLGLSRTGQKIDDCATLIDSNGGEYVARKCLPLLPGPTWGGSGWATWNGQGLFMIKPNVESVFVFEFLPVDRAPQSSNTTYNLISDIEVNKCDFDSSHKIGGLSTHTGCLGQENSVQSLSFFNLTTK